VLWEGDGAHAGRVQDGRGVVDPFDDDGAALRARCHDEARGVRAAYSGKWRALVDGRVSGKNIPCAEAHRGLWGSGVGV